MNRSQVAASKAISDGERDDPHELRDHLEGEEGTAAGPTRRQVPALKYFTTPCCESPPMERKNTAAEHQRDER